MWFVMSLYQLLDQYQVVQTQSVLEFYRDLTEISGFELETACVLKEGKKFWALAKTGKEAALKGNDVVRGYILLATSCDSKLATTATPTTVRVVCNNTLTIAIDGASSAIKVPHSTSFDPQSWLLRMKNRIPMSEQESERWALIPYAANSPARVQVAGRQLAIAAQLKQDIDLNRLVALLTRVSPEDAVIFLSSTKGLDVGLIERFADYSRFVHIFFNSHD